MTTTKHLCHAHDCETQVPERMLMCRPHWFSVRSALQRAIWREYRSGQERTKRPSLRYLAVQQLVICEVAFRPNDEAAAAIAAGYLARAMTFRQKAIDAGEGDPLVGLLPESVGDFLAAPQARLAFVGGAETIVRRPQGG